MEKEKLSIICFSGDFDRAVAAFTLATGAAAANHDVNMFFTFWGLSIVKKRPSRTWIGKGFLEKVFNYMIGGVKNLPLSRFNFGGISPRLMTHLMKKKNVATLAELIAAAKALGIRLTACEMSMVILDIHIDDLMEDVEREVVGVPTFLERSCGAKIIFI